MRFLSRLIVAALAAMSLVLANAATARADLCPPGCGDNDGGGATCRVCDTKPPKPSPGKPGSGKPDLPACPPSRDAIPDGSADDPPEGWVKVRCMEGGLVLLFWVEPRVSPEQIARSLLDEMQLTAIDIGITPKGPDAMALVGLPVWLWVDDPSAATWGPRTISAGGVSMTARASKVVWDLGDGTEVSCGKGTEWTYGMGERPSPTCGHTYDEQGRYTVRATTSWVANWSGYGQSGSFSFELTRSQRLDVGELQVIVTRGE
jgi:hypothetical protein